MKTVLDLPIELLEPDTVAEVTDVSGRPDWVARMAELGIRPGGRLRILRAGHPCLIQVGATRYSYRGDGNGTVIARPVCES